MPPGLINSALVAGPLSPPKPGVPSFPPSAIKSMVSYKATGQNERRLHTLVCLLFDTGLRISEALSVTKENVDLDNLAIKVNGKGGKHRLVPFSLELRKVLWRWWPIRPPQLNDPSRAGY